MITHKLLAEMASDAYPRNWDTLKEKYAPKWTINTYKNKATEMAIYSSDKDLVIAFAGTDVTQLLDILNDADIFETKILGLGNVHRGFFRSSQRLYPTVIRECVLARDAGKKVWITGHSKGAAEATLTAAAICCNGVKPADEGGYLAGVVTWESPRCLSKKAAKKYKEMLGHITYRYVYSVDPVTHVPLGLRFKHVGHLMWWTNGEWRHKMSLFAVLWIALKSKWLVCKHKHRYQWFVDNHAISCMREVHENHPPNKIQLLIP